MDRHQSFEEHRPLLFSLAYRIMGTRADADDIVQDAYLRWLSVDDSEVHSPKSYLTTIVARLAFDALKSAHRKRELYTGQWLPEPLVEPIGPRAVEMSQSLSMAFLHLLESLTPAERVAFLLHDVFDAGYNDIAAILETSEGNCRQLAARARKHVQAGRPRFPVDPQKHIALLEEFLTACASGDPARLAAKLTGDVLLVADGGGKVPSALNPIEGADRVSRFLIGVAKKVGPGVKMDWAVVNGDTGVVLVADGQPVTVLSVTFDPYDRISGVYLVTIPISCGERKPLRPKAGLYGDRRR